MNAKISRFYLYAVISSVITAGCSDHQATQSFAEPIPDVVDFNYDVKPILSDTCYLCHGPDKENARGGLTLSNFADATKHVTDNGLAAVIPGNADDSEAYMRLISDDENYMMPPPDANLVLSAREKAIIKKWIDQGAVYKKHWALITPEKSATPTLKNSAWPLNTVDAFIAKKIEDKGLTPNERADKESLIRRVTFDLTGLPPTIAELDNFLSDQRPNAYQTLVERLMATPAYGERMAVEWLDVARYADTHGYSTDYYRDMSPYRDWVIESFNQNRPFDEFITWQIAGDLLPNSTKEQKLATAFNRIHAQNGEGGIVNEEFRIEYVKDRVQTVGTGLLGLTLHCAQCHDHKYDPISAKDYYSMNAFFNSIDDSGQISYDPNDIPVPTLLLPTPEQEAKLADINAQINAQQSLLSSKYSADNQAFKTWLANNKTTKVKEDTSALMAYYPLSKSDRNKLVASALDKAANGKIIYGSNPKKKQGDPMVHVVEEGREAIKLNGDDPLYFPTVKGFETATAFSLSIDAKIPTEITDGVLMHYNKAGILYNFKGFDIGIENNHWLVRFAHTYPYNAIVLKSKTPVQREQWQNIAMSYNGSGEAAGINFYLDGQAVEMQVERDNLYKEIKHNREGVLKEIGLKVGARWRSRGVPNTLVDNIKVYDRALTAIEFTQALDGASTEDYLALYNQRYNKAYQNDFSKLTALRKEKNSLAEQIQEIMVMKELPEPRQAYLLKRGSYTMLGEKVYPGVPENILPYDESWGDNRLGLARWLTDPKHPLVPRVIVNRYWQMLFGNGLVRTPEDFGNQGQLPTHPALLDWLAREFVESGWDVNHMVQLMVTSATYQQSSKTTAILNEKDPENRLFARGPSGRLSAEMIRDLALAASGLLVDKVGGKSVNPYQPKDIWRMNNMDYHQGSGDDLYRRSMYTIYKRSVPPPNMTAFDAPMRSYSVGVRQETSTPLQSLALLNDPQIVEATRVLSSNVMKANTDVKAQLTSVYRRLTSRIPNEHEYALINDMYSDMVASFTESPADAKDFISTGEYPIDESLDPIKLAALSSVANILINHDASVIKR
ncbi:MAG: DUF1553 domain-containing protein [Thalassotalea sp.]